MARPEFDDELESLFSGDPDLLGAARRVRASRPEPMLDPRYRVVLRAQLMREAESVLAPKRKLRFAPRMGHFAWGSGALGLAMVAALVFTLARPQAPDQTNVAFTSPVLAQKQVSTRNAITVHFNQPMDEQAVVAGVHIEPATEVAYSWSDPKTLTITPAHPLSGNTPYSVTIDHSAARAASGMTPSSDIQITFGTAPTPTPVPAPVITPPTLVLAPLGATANGATVGFTPAGDPVTTRAVLPTTPAPSGSPAASLPLPSLPLPSGLRSPQATATAAPAAGQEAATASFLAGGGAPHRLGAAADAMAFSPNGNQLALAIPTGAHAGGDSILVSRADGGEPVTLATLPSAVTGIAWSDPSTIVVVEGATVKSIDLQHRVTTIASLSGTVTLAPDGAHAFVLPAALTSPSATSPGAAPAVRDGQIVDLLSHDTRTISGSSSGVIAFSGDGKTLAWVDRAQDGLRRVHLSSVATDTSRELPTTNQAGDRISELSLSHDGADVAYTLVTSNGSEQVVVARATTGAIVAVAGGNRHAVVFSANADRIALIGPAGLETAPLPAGAASAPLSPGIPAGAQQAIDGFIAAQVSGDTAALRSLSHGLNAVELTPPGLSRGYLISAVRPDTNTVNATARLIIDPAPGSSTTKLTDENITVSRGADTWTVTAVIVPPLGSETAGPHVTHVNSSSDDRQTVVTVSFDSDLQPGSAEKAISVLRDGQGIGGVTVKYDVASHTATVTYATPRSGRTTLTVSTDLADIDGQHLATASTTTLG